MTNAELLDLIKRQRNGWSLEQTFYCSEKLFELERSTWLSKQWYVLAHRSELAEPGCVIVRELLGESLLILRDKKGQVRGFYNVCRHRGSRLCDEDGRVASGITCPYHAWSYDLEGALRKAPALLTDKDMGGLGLRPVPVREIAGVIFASLSGEPDALEPVREHFEAGLAYHGFPQARIAARRAYPTTGNWKLVIENFRECYHCYPAHPEYCGVMQWVDSIARVPADGGAEWARTLAKWSTEEANPESPIKSLVWPRPTEVTHAASRIPIGDGKKTQSEDGMPVAPLMGQQLRFDGGVTHFLFRPFVTLMALNDHAVMFQFFPRAADSTDVVITWLVDQSARESEVDVERMMWLWDVTTKQDKRLIERNAAGVQSRSYVPGPYTSLEAQAAQSVSHYLGDMARLCNSSSSPLAAGVSHS